MLLRKLTKHRGLAINLLAGLSFLVLAVYGWDLSIKQLLVYLAILVGCLLVVIGTAMLAGFLLRKFSERSDDH